MRLGETCHRTLLAACEIAGSEAKLAQQLDRPLDQVVNWLLGYQAVPSEVFMAAVDIVVDQNTRRVSDSVAFVEEVRRRNRF